MAGQNDSVLCPHLHPLTFAPRHQRQSRHRFALGTRGDDTHISRCVIVNLLHIDKHARGHINQLQINRQLDVFLH